MHDECCTCAGCGHCAFYDSPCPYFEDEQCRALACMPGDEDYEDRTTWACDQWSGDLKIGSKHT